MSNGPTTNGNRGGTLRLSDVVPQIPESQTYQAKIRAACFDGVSEEDAKQIVQSIVKAAKQGDKSAQKMFFDYLAGGGKESQPQQVTVNIVADVETAARIAAEAKRR